MKFLVLLINDYIIFLYNLILCNIYICIYIYICFADLFSPPKLPPVPEECHMSTESSNNIYDQSYGNVSTCYQTNQHVCNESASLSLHSELNQLKMTNMRQESTDTSCPLHAGSYSTGESYQSNFPTVFHQSSNGGADYQSNNHSYNSISSGTAQTHHNEMQLPPPPPAYPFTEFSTSNIGHEPVMNSNSYGQHQDMSATDNSVMTYGNGNHSSSSTNDFKNRTSQVQTYSKFLPAVRNSQDLFVAPKVIVKQCTYACERYSIRFVACFRLDKGHAAGKCSQNKKSCRRV